MSSPHMIRDVTFFVKTVTKPDGSYVEGAHMLVSIFDAIQLLHECQMLAMEIDRLTKLKTPTGAGIN